MKSLTKQWEEGTLKRGYYYYKTKIGAKVIGYQCFGLKFPYDYNHNTIDSVKEVLAPLPSYYEYKELVRKSDKLDKIMSDAVTNQGDCQQIEIDNLNREAERLQEQLKEANELFLKIELKIENQSDLTTKIENKIYEMIDDYLKKWNINIFE